MLYTLENEKFKIIANNHGAELSSISSKEDGTEYLWNGNKKYWGYHAPVLFPIVGKVKNGIYRVDGKEYNLPQHGLARVSEFELIEKSENKLVFELLYSEETLKIYPYKFSLKITYSLVEDGVITAYTVENKDDKDIYFSIGAHPAFMCPIKGGELIDDYYFEFNEKETVNKMPINKEGYIKRETVECLNNSNIINLSFDLFKDELAKGEKVSVSGFGVFKISERSAREGRNPQTGEKIKIAASKSVSFKAGTELKTKIN